VVIPNVQKCSLAVLALAKNEESDLALKVGLCSDIYLALLTIDPAPRHRHPYPTHYAPPNTSPCIATNPPNIHARTSPRQLPSRILPFLTARPHYTISCLFSYETPYGAASYRWESRSECGMEKRGGLGNCHDLEPVGSIEENLWRCHL
jgi:hypothetical protein